MQKTIFITITKSLITRNILRSGILELLKKSGYKIIIFFQAGNIPDYLKEEFEDEQVKLVSYRASLTKFHRVFNILKSYLLLTKTTKLLIFYRRSTAKRLENDDLPKRSALLKYLRFGCLVVLSKFYFLKLIYRYLELKLFSEKNKVIQGFFEKYQPDLVFSTSVISTLDVALMKEAKRRKIKTVAMPKSWDNLTNCYYRFLPDYFLVPNEASIKIIEELQSMAPKKTYAVGIPQFDWYAKKEIIRNRDEHLRSKGLDPKLSLIFFGSEGLWTPRDHLIAAKIYEWIKNDELVKPCQLLVRPHYSNVTLDVFKDLRNKDKVIVDDYRITNFFSDRWDQSIPEIIDFTNSVFCCDVMVNVASTLGLDAACADRPIINLGFDCLIDGGKDVTLSCFFQTDHYKTVLDINATSIVMSFDELKKQINEYLLNPSLKSNERRILCEKICYKVDGNSSARIASVINNILLK